MPPVIAKPQKAVLETVAKQLGATWEEGEIGRAAMPRLRFDRVALGIVRRLQAALDDAVPDAGTLVVTITAPIREPAKTAAALEDEIRSWLARHMPGAATPAEVRHTIHGNRIRVRLVKGSVEGAVRVIGLVHNPEPDPAALLDLAQRLVQSIAAARGVKPVPIRRARATRVRGRPP